MNDKTRYNRPRLCDCDECTADNAIRLQHDPGCDCPVCRAQILRASTPTTSTHILDTDARGETHWAEVEPRSIWHLMAFCLGVAISGVGAIAFLLGLLYTDGLMGLGGGAALVFGMIMVTLSERSKR